MKLNMFWKKYRILILIIVLGLVPRMVAGIYFGNVVEALPGTFDQISYHNLALRLADGYGFSFSETWWPLTEPDSPTAHWSYLYTAYLATIYKLFGPVPVAARLIQAVVVGIMQPLLIYLLGRHIFSKSVGLVAAALMAIYAYFIYYSATLMTEPFYITGILASLYLAIRLAETDRVKTQHWLALGLGVTLGLTVLLRQLYLLFIPILLIWLVWAFYRRFGNFPITSVILIGGVILAVILPFTIYNYTRFQRFVLLNTNAGYAFFWANHPAYGTQFEPILPPEMGKYQDLIPAELRQLDEATLDRELLKLGVRFVLEDPGRYALLSLSRIPVYFMFWPSADSSIIGNISRLFSFGILWPFMLYGIFYAAHKRLSSTFLTTPMFLLILFAGFYTLIHVLSWTLIRYRLPVDAVLLIFAAVAILNLAQRLRQKEVAGEAMTASGS